MTLPAVPDGTMLYLGNHAAVDHRGAVDEDGSPVLDGRGERVLVRTPLDGKRCTAVRIADGSAYVDAVADVMRLWPHMSDAAGPVWVACVDSDLADVLGILWGCEIRIPDPEA